jgi:hypothetical protein
MLLSEKLSLVNVIRLTIRRIIKAQEYSGRRTPAKNFEKKSSEESAFPKKLEQIILCKNVFGKKKFAFARSKELSL